MERPNLLNECRQIAHSLGFELMWWQEHVLAVATELVPSTSFVNGQLFGAVVPGRSGLWLPAYREVVCSVPRQQGKTFMLLVKKLQRAILWGPAVGRIQRLVYTAQTGRDAVKKVLEDEVPIIEASPLRIMVEQVRRVNGSEGLLFKNKSRIDILASSESSGHGRTVDEGYIDEAFDDVDDRREQAILPAMSTRIDGQLWVVSTMGTDDSVYLNRKIETGREAAFTAGSEIAYCEFSADPNADIDDPRTHDSCMPAKGITIDNRAIRHARQTMTEGEFRRAFLNQRTASDERIIPEATWRAVCNEFVVPDGRLVFAVDCDPDRNGGSVARADQTGRVELLEKESGTGWIIPTLRGLCQKWGAQVAIDPGGPAAFLIPDLEREGVRLVEVGGRDFARACGLFYTAVADKTIEVRSDGRLDLALAAAKKRETGDAWAFARKSSSADISPLVAVTLAHWAAQLEPGPSTYWSSDDL